MSDPKKKLTNPKDAVGVHKVPFGTLSQAVLAEVGLAFLEGARKYGRHNYRPAGVRASVYFDANGRHMARWWEGEDNDPDSGLNHVVKAIASLVVLRDSMITGNWTDDRPPALPAGWMDALNVKAGEIVDRYPSGVEALTEAGEKAKRAAEIAARISAAQPAPKSSRRSGSPKSRSRSKSRRA